MFAGKSPLHELPDLSLRSCKRELSEDPRVFSKYFPTKNEFALKLYLSPIKKKHRFLNGAVYLLFYTMREVEGRKCFSAD